MATTPITQKQIDTCARVIDFNDHCRIFYQVRSERDPLVEYIVRYEHDPRNPSKGYFTCTCPAGQEGFFTDHKAPASTFGGHWQP